MEKVLNMTYASSLADLCEINSSFDSGVLRIAYPGVNRNNSSISKEVFEKCIQTMYNCPIVCNYDRETDTLGGHDMEMVRDASGGLRIVNMTTPVGCIPESAKWWWDTVEEEDGTVHEYLFADVLLWKRQEAYRKIKRDGITAHSMEITVKDGESIDGIFNIYDFEFTAFALIGCEPCFEGSALEVFSRQDFKRQLSEMMQDLKESFNLVDSLPKRRDEDNNNYSLTKGGQDILDDNIEITATETLDNNTITSTAGDVTLPETYSVSASTEAGEAEIQEEFANNEPVDEVVSETEPEQDSFALTSNVVNEIVRVLSEETVSNEWGEYSRYCFVDCDFDLQEVYCWDSEDWLLYGFAYQVDGDSVTIDYDSKTRKKYIIADFDEGEQASPFAPMFEKMTEAVHNGAQWEEKFQNASAVISAMESELNELREYKQRVEDEAARSARADILSRFEDLAGIEAYDNLCDDCMNYSVDEIEEKCFAIRGRNVAVAKFTLESKAPKIKVEKSDTSVEPYGGLFVEYDSKNN